MSTRKKSPRRAREDAEAAQKTALRSRLLDMLKGANGGYELEMETLTGEEAQPIGWTFGNDIWGRWLGAVRREWFTKDDDGVGHFAFQAEHLHDLEMFDGAVERLYQLGARA